ncbi:hypothetical protein M0813_22498 [Anaeramoeba flamelloides]|uniref:GAF domain-containing protein n=1 Tax=Anaeramoeba flamelloides TaxID=1746091 RepID=A0ABQ8YCP2_9EUKA|nr:hypothetical protein M0813_22498 [Anaeramoeba flamelloides]
MGNSGIGQTFLPPENVDLCTLKKYSKIIRDNSEIICLINQQGDLIDCNESFAKYLKFEDVDTVKIAVYHFANICCEAQENTEKPLMNQIREKIGSAISGGGCDFDWKIKNFQNNTLPCHIWFKPVRLKGGVMIQVVIRNKVTNKEKIKSINTSLTTDESLTSREIADWCIEEGVRITNSTIGYLAFVSKDQSYIHLYGWSNSAMNECAMINRPVKYETAKTGLWGEAVRQRKAVITNDYKKKNKMKKGTPKGHVALSRHMNVPVFYDPKKGNVKKNYVVLIAGVANKSTNYTSGDIKNLTNLMNKMWVIFKKKYDM